MNSTPVSTAKQTTDLSALAVEINEHHRAAEDAASNALEHAHQAGVLLREAKDRCDHGDFGKWLKANFRGSKRTAQIYMRVAEPFNWERIQQRNGVAHLQIDQYQLMGVKGAAKLLAKPRRPKVQPDPSEDPIDVPVDDHVDKPVDAQADTPTEVSFCILCGSKGDCDCAAKYSPKDVFGDICPNCGADDWTEDEDGKYCAKCKHTYGEPVDEEPVNQPEKPKTKKVGKGIILAHEAINVLQRIPKNDQFRQRAAEIVKDWVAKNLEGEA